MNDNNKNNKNKNKNTNNDGSSGLTIGMCIGIAIGTAIGSATYVFAATYVPLMKKCSVLRSKGPEVYKPGSVR